MLSYFYIIWNVIIKTISHVNITVWKILASLFGLVVCVFVLINFNRIRNQCVVCDACFGDLNASGLTLDFKCNHAIVRKTANPMSLLSAEFTPNDNDLTCISDSTKQAFINIFADSVDDVQDVKYAYDFSCKYSDDQPSLLFPSKKYIYKNNMNVFLIADPLEIKRMNGVEDSKYNYTIYQHCTVASSSLFSLEEGNCMFAVSFFNSHPYLMSLRDISQCVYTYKVNTDSKSVKRISFDFMGVVDFSNMYPVPDKITMTGMEYTDSLKLKEILNRGITFHAEFPQARNLQTIRINVLSLFLSLFFSLFVSMSFKAIKNIILKKRFEVK